jgi:hypothetical protein
MFFSRQEEMELRTWIELVVKESGFEPNPSYSAGHKCMHHSPSYSRGWGRKITLDQEFKASLGNMARVCLKDIIWALVVHTCNLSYSGGRDQEDRSLRSAPANSSQDPISKKPFTKKGWWSGSRYKPWVQTPIPQIMIIIMMMIVSVRKAYTTHKP